MRKVFFDDQLQAEFDRKGFVVVRLFSEQEVLKFLDDVKHLEPEEKFSGSNYLSFSTLHTTAFESDQQYKECADQIVRDHISPKIDGLIDLEIFYCNLFMKPKGSGLLPMHQNWTILEDYTDTTVSVWCPLVELTDSNGPLRLIEGSHKIHPHIATMCEPPYYAEFQDALEDEATPIQVKLGEALIFDDSIIHGSNHNLSDAPRYAVQAVCVPKGARTVYYKSDAQAPGSDFQVFEHDMGFVTSHTGIDYFRGNIIGKRLGSMKNPNRLISRAEFDELLNNGDHARRSLDTGNKETISENTAGHLIHIGLPKAGSTFLQRWFNQHPAFCHADFKLAGFADATDIARFPDKGPPGFRYFVTSNEEFSLPLLQNSETVHLPGMKALLAFGTPNFLKKVKAHDHQYRTASTLHKLYPDAKILLVTRGFDSFVKSVYSQYARTAGILSFSEIRQRLWETGCLNYNHLIGTYESLFGKENVIILPFELLRDDQKKFLAAIEDSLKIPHFETQIGRLNESITDAEIYWYPRISRLVSRVMMRLGRRLFNKLYTVYIGIVFQGYLGFLARMLRKVALGRTFVAENCPPAMAEEFGYNARKLRDIEDFAPYWREYYLD